MENPFTTPAVQGLKLYGRPVITNKRGKIVFLRHFFG